jgi:hypothetical protein
MEGKVKITVIATGFDQARTASAPAAQSNKTTPVDLSSYTAVRTQTEERLVANGGRITVARRQVLDLPSFAGIKVSNATPAASTSDASADGEDASPLDVPAFLRRQEN